MMEPQGKLIIIGGHEDKILDNKNLLIDKTDDHKPYHEILLTLTVKAPKGHHIIEIIAAASSIPSEMEEEYITAYKSAGYDHVGIIRIETPEDANDPGLIKRIDYCHAVFFTGGDQNKLTAVLNDSAILQAIKNKYVKDKNFIVAGTSAGAMAMPKTIIEGGIIREALIKNDIRIGKGFDLNSDIIVDTHFIKRGRFARLAHAVALNPTLLGIGLGEDTALIITNGNEAECIGSGMVIIIDGTGIKKTNIATVDEYTPIIISDLKVHILAEGSVFLIKEKTFK